MIHQIKNDLKQDMDKTIESFEDSLKKIRTGRANISMLDSIKVDYYGQMTPLNQVSTVSCPDARTFLIVPWEAKVLKEIESAFVKSDLGMAPISDGKAIRLKVPELTEERRKEMIKMVNSIAEQSRTSIRILRRDANEKIKKSQGNSEISEDERDSGEEEVQILTDQYIGKIQKISEAKGQELMSF